MRAPRYVMNAPVQFRVQSGQWFDGTTVNISALGVLIRTTHAQTPPAPVELKIALTGADSSPHAHVTCAGHVVRCEPDRHRGDALVAIAIESFRLRDVSATEDTE